MGAKIIFLNKKAPQCGAFCGDMFNKAIKKITFIKIKISLLPKTDKYNLLEDQKFP